MANTAFSFNKRNRSTDLLHRMLSIDQRGIFLWWFIHLSWAVRLPITQQIETPGIKAESCQLIHPGHSFNLVVKRIARAIGGPMNKQHGHAWQALVLITQVLVSQQELKTIS